jgi:hypothetical protein
MLDDLGALREAAGKPGVGYPDTRQQLPEERVGALKSFGAHLVADPTRPGPARYQAVVVVVRNTRRNLPIVISSPLASTAESTNSRLT